MRRVIVLFFSCGWVLSTFAAQPPTWSLKTRINDIELSGEWELAQEAQAGLSTSEIEQRAASWIVSVTAGSSFQLSADLLSPLLARQGVTGSPKISYEANRCLSINSAGQATVDDGEPCQSGTLISLTLTYFDQAEQIIAMNSYRLKIA